MVGYKGYRSKTNFIILSKLTFQARNKSNLAIDTQLGMEVNILDINDNPPIFQRKVYDVTINEAAKQGQYHCLTIAFSSTAIMGISGLIYCTLLFKSYMAVFSN